MEKSTKASATASSTSEPVFRTRMALTEDDSRLDWLIPYPGPDSSEGGKQLWESHKCNSVTLETLRSLRGRGEKKKPMGQSILKAILYFLGTFGFLSNKMVKAIKITDSVWKTNIKKSSYDTFMTRRQKKEWVAKGLQICSPCNYPALSVRQISSIQVSHGAVQNKDQTSNQ